MILPINKTIKYYAQSTIQFSDLFVTRLAPGIVDGNRYTSPNVCGLVVTLSGSATFSLNGEKYQLNKGVILHAGPSMLLEIEAKDELPWEYVVIHYRFIEGKRHYKDKHFLIEVGHNHKVDYLVQQLIYHDALPDDLMRLKCRLLFHQFIETILVCAKMHTTDNTVDLALTFLTEHYMQPITITEVAEQVGCERRRLSYLFEKQVGMSPIQYLTEIRLKHATKLLRTSDMPIYQVAEHVGYTDSFYFCRLFKKHYTQSPTQFRAQMLAYAQKSR